MLAKDVDDILYRIHDLRFSQALQINSLFISYSHKNSAFVDEMENHLNEKGIRFWRDTHDATAGRLEKVINRAIRKNPIVLLILSENSVQSDWVEHEARSARELEKELKRDVLCPVALDGSWKTCDWEARLREQIMKYNILDFSNWKDEAEFTKKFAKLVEGLDLFYKE
ncbi:MAG: toll/interleukin-1 receptor domain-containing protein [Chloroflexi bacterium]|nr:toll/interleukin-1 receptor domain-containing protein [Chloroflexota bacterium]